MLSSYYGYSQVVPDVAVCPAEGRVPPSAARPPAGARTPAPRWVLVRKAALSMHPAKLIIVANSNNAASGHRAISIELTCVRLRGNYLTWYDIPGTNSPQASDQSVLLYPIYGARCEILMCCCKYRNDGFM